MNYWLCLLHTVETAGLLQSIFHQTLVETQAFHYIRGKVTQSRFYPVLILMHRNWCITDSNFSKMTAYLGDDFAYISSYCSFKWRNSILQQPKHLLTSPRLSAILDHLPVIHQWPLFLLKSQHCWITSNWRSTQFDNEFTNNDLLRRCFYCIAAFESHMFPVVCFSVRL